MATRNAAYWPFVASDPWNHPLGSGAKFTNSTSPVFNVNGGGGVNCTRWSHPVYIASSSDPVRNIYQTGNSTPVVKVNIPGGATADLETDGYLHIIDPQSSFVVEMWQAKKRSNGDFEASRVEKNDLKGPGVYATNHGCRAYGGSAIGGLIRKGELGNGIPHALAIAMNRESLNRFAPGGNGYTWPASGCDWDVSSYATTGNLYMGSLLGIPPSVDIKTIGVGSSGPGYQIARALQDYGAYICDSAGANIVFYLEPSASSEMPPTIGDHLLKIVRHLKVVTNNTPKTIGGGGTPRRSFAPAF